MFDIVNQKKLLKKVSPETADMIVDALRKPMTDEKKKLEKITDILIEMHKAHNDPRYCEGLSKHNIRDEFRVWAKKILEL